MTATEVGVSYLPPETTNPIFFPRAFTRSYNQSIDQETSSVVIQAELDAITAELIPITAIFGTVGSYYNWGMGVQLTGNASGTTTAIFSFSIQAGNVAMLNYSLVMNAGGVTTGTLTSSCISIIDGNTSVAVSNYYQPRLNSQSGSWQYWYANNNVTIKNTATSTHTYYLTINPIYSGFSPFYIQGQNSIVPMVQVVILSTNV